MLIGSSTSFLFKLHRDTRQSLVPELMHLSASSWFTLASTDNSSLNSWIAFSKYIFNALKKCLLLSFLFNFPVHMIHHASLWSDFRLITDDNAVVIEPIRIDRIAIQQCSQCIDSIVDLHTKRRFIKFTSDHATIITFREPSFIKTINTLIGLSWWTCNEVSLNSVIALKNSPPRFIKCLQPVLLPKPFRLDGSMKLRSLANYQIVTLLQSPFREWIHFDRI